MKMGVFRLKRCHASHLNGSSLITQMQDLTQGGLITKQFFRDLFRYHNLVYSMQRRFWITFLQRKAEEGKEISVGGVNLFFVEGDHVRWSVRKANDKVARCIDPHGVF